MDLENRQFCGFDLLINLWVNYLVQFNIFSCSFLVLGLVKFEPFSIFIALVFSPNSLRFCYQVTSFNPPSSLIEYTFLLGTWLVDFGCVWVVEYKKLRTQSNSCSQKFSWSSWSFTISCFVNQNIFLFHLRVRAAFAYIQVVLVTTEQTLRWVLGIWLRQ